MTTDEPLTIHLNRDVRAGDVLCYATPDLRDRYYEWSYCRIDENGLPLTGWESLPSVGMNEAYVPLEWAAGAHDITVRCEMRTR